ncbi:DNA replication/repair protein RecF [Roseiflexus sp.]|uniref:DNA replication/repair protein RecF n=1 Tax=Roseiflexus sp. TaxID=2562120 RepID=UPI00398ABE23
MYVTHLSLRDFRNYERLDLKLERGVTLLYGPNAAGKTTVLEAIYFLATTRSPRAGADRELVRFGAQGDVGVPPFARLVCDVMRNDGHVRLEVVVQRRAEEEMATGTAPTIKTVRVDRKAVRALDLVGNLRVVLFTPADVALVTGAPTERRRYLDVTLSQIDGRYVRTLAHYQKVVQQRNSLLRAWREGRRPLRYADDELAFWDRELAMAGTYLLRERLRAIVDLSALAGPLYCRMSGGDTPLVLTYQSSVAGVEPATDSRAIEQAFLAHLERLRDDEIGRGQTLIGPHRDDVLIAAGGVPVGAYGSRGQQRSATLALKLGEAELMQMRTGDAPVLLLDDLLSELDAERRAHVQDVLERPDQQTVVTATGTTDFDLDFLSRTRRWRVESGHLYPA